MAQREDVHTTLRIMYSRENLLESSAGKWLRCPLAFSRRVEVGRGRREKEEGRGRRGKEEGGRGRRAKEEGRGKGEIRGEEGNGRMVKGRREGDRAEGGGKR